jgi:hypothetical protein
MGGQLVDAVTVRRACDDYIDVIRCVAASCPATQVREGAAGP